MITNDSVINAPIYFKLFECGKNFLNRLDATFEQACMENSKDKYYKELCNNITYYNDLNNKPLSNVKIQELILQY